MYFVDLYVGLREGNHLRENVDNVKVLHLVPLIRRLMEHMDTICSLRRLTVMHNVRNEIVASLFVVFLVFRRQYIAKVDIPIVE